MSGQNNSVAISLHCLLSCHCASLYTSDNSQALPYLYPPMKQMKTADGSPFNLPFFGLNTPSSLYLLVYVTCSSMSTTCWWYTGITLVSQYLSYTGDQNCTQYTTYGITSARQRKIASLDLLSILLLIQDSMQFTFISARSECCLMIILLSTWDPSYFSVKLLSILLVPSLYCCISHLSLMYFLRFLPAHFSRLSRPLWISALPSHVLSAHSNLALLANILRGLYPLI